MAFLRDVPELAPATAYTTDAASAVYADRADTHKVRASGGRNQSPLSGTATALDGVTLVAGDHVLITTNTLDMTSAGPWIVQSGDWVRPAYWVVGESGHGHLWYIDQGTTRADQIWKCTSNEGSAVIGTDTLTFEVLFIGGFSGPFGITFADATTGTGVGFSAFLSQFLHFGVTSFTMRGESASGIQCAFFPSFGPDSNLGLPFGFGVNGFTWMRVSAAQYGTTQQDVAFTATPTFDINGGASGATRGCYKTITLTADITSWTVTAPTVSAYGVAIGGIPLYIRFTQDGTGGWTLSAPPSNVLLTGGSLTITATAGKSTLLKLLWDSTLSKWIESSRALDL